MSKIIYSDKTLAFKCPACGDIKYEELNIFNFANKKYKSITCDCGQKGLDLYLKDNICQIFINCFACNQTHVFRAEINQLIFKTINIFSCPDRKIQIGYLGKDTNVIDAVNKYENHLDSILDEIGDYDNYFSNNAVMLNAINVIHDIAEKGNLICRCGRNNVMLHMYKDKIALRCYECNTFEIIRAKSYTDIKNMIEKKKIILNKKLKGAK